jgi:cephalosporin hydroxylase
VAPLPPPVSLELGETVRDYWLRRVEQHTDDVYAGLRISKFPEDLRVYEHLIWIARPDVVIELGSQFGGSALWFRDRLRAAASYGRVEDARVIAVDVDLEQAREGLASADPSYEVDIELLEGDVCDPDLPDRVGALLPKGARCLVIEDTAHLYETTMAALQGFARFVPSDGFFVVEDGCVDVPEMRAHADWPAGVLPAVTEWLAGEAGRCFVQRRDLELYGISCHPQGFLQRRAPGP